jgi:hypothetical protein
MENHKIPGFHTTNQILIIGLILEQIGVSKDSTGVNHIYI